MKIFAQDVDGDHNLEMDFPYSGLKAAVNYIKAEGGYYIKEDDVEVFVPWHRIAFIREEKP